MRMAYKEVAKEPGMPILQFMVLNIFYIKGPFLSMIGVIAQLGER